MFPPFFWFTRFQTWKPVFTGSDEWYRKTICIGIPYLIYLVVPRRGCIETDDLLVEWDFSCTFPCCPYMAMSPGEPCLTHDIEFWTEIDNERNNR